MGRRRAGLGIHQLVILPGKNNDLLFSSGRLPEGTYDRNGLCQGTERLSWRALASSIGGDAFPETARAQSQFESPLCQNIQCRSRFGQHGWWTQRQIDDIGEKAYVPRPGSEEGEQGPGIEELGVIGVILNADEIRLCTISYVSQAVCQLQVLLRRVNIQPE